jgi:CHASE2 domain-containing sensor protein
MIFGSHIENRFRLRLARAWRRNRYVCVALLITGLAFTLYPGSHSIRRLSFDLPFLFSSSHPVDDVVIVAVDNEDMDSLKLSRRDQLPRSIHAKLLDRLKVARARLVLFDFVFDSPGANPDEDRDFAKAIGGAGCVILGGFQDTRNQRYQGPVEPMQSAAVGWGLLDLKQDLDDGVRELYRKTSGSPEILYAPARAVAWLQKGNSSSSTFQGGKLWLNYRGPPGNGSFRCESLSRVLDPTSVPDSSLAGKVVVVSRRDELSNSDRFPHPWSRWGVAKFWGDEIHATALTNLLKGDALREVSRSWQAIALVAWTLVVALGSACLSARTATWAWLAGSVALVALGFATQLKWQLWWCWALPVLSGALAYVWNLGTRAFTRGSVFISYRREDAATALWLASELRAASYDVYLDVERLRPGDYWSEKLLEEVRGSEMLIPIISNRTFHAEVSSGDFLLREIGVALEQGKKIVPVLVDGFQWSRFFDSHPAGDIREELRSLARIQGTHCNSGTAKTTIPELLEALS